MSLSIYCIVIFSLLCTANACVSDSDCSLNYYCPYSGAVCATQQSFGTPCTPNRAGRNQCATGLFCQSTPSGGTCIYTSSNGQACTSNQACSSGYCDGKSNQCQNNPVFNPITEGAAIAISTIIIISIAAPVGICILICVCCYYCGRRQPVIITNRQPQVVVASIGTSSGMLQSPMMVAAVPMQQQPMPYYMPQQQPPYAPQPYAPYAPQPQPYAPQPYTAPQSYTAPQAYGGYQPLHNEPQQQPTQVEGTPYPVQATPVAPASNTTTI